MLAPRARRASLAKSAFAAKSKRFAHFGGGANPQAAPPHPGYVRRRGNPCSHATRRTTHIFRLDNLNSQSNYGIDVLVLLDGKEIFK